MTNPAIIRQPFQLTFFEQWQTQYDQKISNDKIKIKNKTQDMGKEYFIKEIFKRKIKILFAMPKNQNALYIG